MAVNDRMVAVGLREVHIGKRGSDGTMEVPTATGKATAYSGVQVYKSRAFTITPAAAQRINAGGDDRIYHTFQEAPNELPTGELRTSINDFLTLAMITSVSEFGSPDNRKEIMVATDKIGEEDQLIIWGTRKAAGAEPGLASYGSRAWETYIVLAAYAHARPSPMEIFTVGETVYDIACNMSSVDEYGRTMTEAIHGCTEAAFVIVHTDHKFWMDVALGNGAATSMTLTKGSQTIYNTATSPIKLFIDGVEQSGHTCTSAGVLSFGSTPADNANIVVCYEWNS